MIELLRRYFAYPTNASVEVATRARTFHRVALGYLIIASAILLLLIAIEPESLARRMTNIGLLVAVVVPLIELNRRGHTRLAGLLLMLGMVAIVTRSALTSGGLATPIGYFMVFFVALGGLLFSARGAIVCTILLGLLGLVLLALGQAGLLPEPSITYTPLTTWLLAILCMGLSLMVQREVSNSVGSSLQRAGSEIQAREQAQDRLRLAVAEGNLGVWVLDVQTRLFQADRSLLDLLAIPAAPGQSVPFDMWLERIHPDDRSAAARAMNDVIAGKHDVRAEYRIVRPDGTIRYVEGTGVLEHDPNATSHSVVGMSRDVTARKRTELEREMLFHDLGERVKELGLLHDVARLLQQDKHTDKELFEQLVAKLPAAWQYPECCVARLVFRDTVATSPGWRETPWMQSIDFQTSAGTGRIEIAYLEPRPDEADGPFLAEERALLESLAEMLAAHEELRRYRQELEALVATRTRQMREARDEAERASRAKGDFLATMSHEIRTPMNAILGYAQLLRRDPSLQPAQHERLDAILASGDHLLTLINNVLDMSKIEAGKTTLAAAPFDLHVLLGDVQKMFAALVAARSLELSFEGISGLPRFVNADAGRIRQVLINLLSNALKFTRHGSIHVRVSCESTPQAHHLAIAVTDTGAGIDAGFQTRVFEVFEQSAVGVRAGGAGLGLPISRELARLMGGDLTVHSEEGTGSTFTFTFQAGVAGSPAAMASRRIARIRPAHGNPRVLVVDDQPDNLTIADEMLRGVGFRTHLAMRGDEALQATAAWQPDLILMDVRMPGMSGIEVIRRLRADGVTTPVVSFTASGLDQMAEEAREAGADDVLFKPCRETLLLETLGRLLAIGFEYEEIPGGPADDIDGKRTAPERVLGEELPGELLEELLRAAVQARIARIASLADQAELYSPEVAARIRQLAGAFRLDELIAELRAAKPGTSA